MWAGARPGGIGLWTPPDVARQSVAHSWVLALAQSQHVQFDLGFQSSKRRRYFEVTGPSPASDRGQAKHQRDKPHKPRTALIDHGQSTPQQQRHTCQQDSEDPARSADGVDEQACFPDTDLPFPFLRGQIGIAMNVHFEQVRRKQKKLQQQPGHQLGRARINQLTRVAATAPTPAAIKTDLKGAQWM
jgi:hypothetical protein